VLRFFLSARAGSARRGSTGRWQERAFWSAALPASGLFGLLLFASSALGAEPGAGASGTPGALSEISADEFRPQFRTPAWDLSILGGACLGADGSGSTDLALCLGASGELLFDRKVEEDNAWGAYAQMSSSLVQDARLSLGATYLVPLSEWWMVQAKLAPLLRLTDHAAPGAQLGLEFGQRSVQYDSAYTMAHTLFVQFDWAAPVSEHSSYCTLFIGLRIDAYWLTAPAMLLQ